MSYRGPNQKESIFTKLPESGGFTNSPEVRSWLIVPVSLRLRSLVSGALPA